MELTIEQALLKAVEAHKAGKLQDAEGLYRAILKAQPKHPDANHNLGVLAVSVNKSEAALLLFKTALEANPSQGQFWLSYIDALIKEKQFDNARDVLNKGKKSGLAGKKVDALEELLATNCFVPGSDSTLPTKNPTFIQQRKKVSAKKEKKKNQYLNQKNLNKAISPSQLDINTVLERYQTGRYDLAENLAKDLIQKYPDHQFGWKVLGAVFKKLGQLPEALVANRRAVEILPNDAEAHMEMGNTLKILGRLEEAEKSYRKAISMKPEYAEAYSNLGNTLRELGKLEDAEISCRKSCEIKPDLAEAHYCLANTLKELGRMDQAINSFRNTLALKPDLAEALYSLGLIYTEARKYEDAAALFKLIDFKNSQGYLLRCLYFLNDQSLFQDKLNYLIQQGEISPMIGSLTHHAEIRYGFVRPNLFCSDPLKYVFTSKLTEQYDFPNIFVKPAKTILSGNRIKTRIQGQLINGRQTAGNLFTLESDLTSEIKSIIHSEIKKYLYYFKDSSEGLIKNWPIDYSLYGWLICMKSGGELRPHMHETGWISGTIYINVPSKSNVDSGNLVVCLGHESYHSEGNKNCKKSIDVTTGSLCLFPASLLHYTIPFESEEERIVLAFDVVPNNR